MNNHAIQKQKEICQKYKSRWVHAPSDMKVGIAKNVKEGAFPLHGLRHPVEGDTTGWYIWAGEELSSEDNFFEPLHVSHLAERCPDSIPFLGLEPGMRFLLAPGQEEVWYDEALLDI